MAILTTVVLILLVVVSLALVGLILIQRGKGGGLAGAFGGSGVEQAFGTHAATLAQKATAVLGVLFLVLTVALGIMYGNSRGTKYEAAGTSTETHEGHDHAPAAPAPAPKEAR